MLLNIDVEKNLQSHGCVSSKKEFQRKMGDARELFERVPLCYLCFLAFIRVIFVARCTYFEQRLSASYEKRAIATIPKDQATRDEEEFSRGRVWGRRGWRAVKNASAEGVTRWRGSRNSNQFPWVISITHLSSCFPLFARPETNKTRGSSLD